MPDDAGSIAEESVETEGQTESIADDETDGQQEQQEQKEHGEEQKSAEPEGQENKQAADWTLEAPEDFQLPEDNLKSFTDAAKSTDLPASKPRACSTGIGIFTML